MTKKSTLTIESGMNVLIDLVHAGASFKRAVSAAVEAELRQMVNYLEMNTHDYFTKLAEIEPEDRRKDDLWKAHKANLRGYKEGRMEAFCAAVIGEADLFDLDWTPDKNDPAKAYVNLKCVRLTDTGEMQGAEPVITARFSDTFNTYSAGWFRWALINPTEALQALAKASNLTASIREFLDTEAEQRAESAKAETASGEAESEASKPLPEDTPEEIVEAWNASQSVTRVIRNAGGTLVSTDDGKAFLAELTTRLQDMAREIAETAKEAKAAAKAA